MKAYVDGFVLVVPKENVEAYKEMARIGAETWKRHGALDYKECMGEDLDPKTPDSMQGMEPPRKFTDLMQAGPNDTVWFSFITFASKEQRDAINAQVMKEMEEQMKEYKDKPMPFDMKKMAYGGFEVVIDQADIM